MGMTIWIHTREGRSMSTESPDLSALYDLSDVLDAQCRELGIAELSGWFDRTDLDYCMGSEEAEDEDYDFEDDDEEDEEDELDPDALERAAELDPETGLGYSLDDMQWFDASTGLEALSTLRAHLEENDVLDIDEDTRAQLLEELDECIDALRGPAANGGHFHLALIM